MSKPTIILDIDGVLNPYGKAVPKLMYDEWVKREIVDSYGKTFVVDIAEPVIEFFDMVHDEELAEIVWHTTWQHDAERVAKAFSLPRNLRVLDAPEFEAYERGTAHGWWKLPAVQRHMSATHGPTIWIDDDLDMGWDRGLTRPYRHPLLVVVPDQDEGLRLDHLAIIEAQLKEWNR